MDWKKYIEERKIVRQDMIALIQTLYPKYTKITQSLIENHLYGVDLPRDAAKLVIETYGGTDYDKTLLLEMIKDLEGKK